MNIWIYYHTTRFYLYFVLWLTINFLLKIPARLRILLTQNLLNCSFRINFNKISFTFLIIYLSFWSTELQTSQLINLRASQIINCRLITCIRIQWATKRSFQFLLIKLILWFNLGLLITFILLFLQAFINSEFRNIIANN